MVQQQLELIQQLSEQLQQQEDQSLLKHYNGQLEKFGQMTVLQVEELNKLVSYKEQTNRELQSQLRNLNIDIQEQDFEKQVGILADKRQSIEREIAKLNDSIQRMLNDNERTVGEIESVKNKLSSDQVDEIELRLKLYRSLGFKWMKDGDEQQLRKCRIKNSSGDDVQTLNVEDTESSTFEVTTKLWNFAE
ncbi:hypothetical protein MIR68_011281 [Amoeboaphelidium protococcarum]|nr:hypothetical protein MIR68_011281 [Amoeboaphelidium protococcarum]